MGTRVQRKLASGMQCPVSLYQEPLMVKRTRRALSIAEIVSVGNSTFNPRKMIIPIFGAAVALVAAPVALPLIGFGAGGIAAGSYAASMMSAAAIANGGGVASMAAGGIIATCQSIGAAGIGLQSAASLATAGGLAGAAISE